MHPGHGSDRPLIELDAAQRLCGGQLRGATLPGWIEPTRLLHLQMVCTREAGTVGAMIPDRICCPA